MSSVQVLGRSAPGSWWSRWAAVLQMFLKTGWPVQEVNEVGKLSVSRQSGAALYYNSAGGGMQQSYCESLSHVMSTDEHICIRGFLCKIVKQRILIFYFLGSFFNYF